jgi:translation initiation factor 4G
VGATLEKKGGTVKLFEKLGELRHCEKLGFRMRFMVQDTIDLKKDRWVSRLASDVKVTKLSEVHKEDTSEKKRAQRREREKAENAARGGGSSGGGGGGKSRSNRSPREEQDDEGFTAAPMGKKGRKGKDKGKASSPTKKDDKSRSANNTPTHKDKRNAVANGSQGAGRGGPKKPTAKQQMMSKGRGGFGALLGDDDEEEEEDKSESDEEEDAPVPEKSVVVEKITSSIKEYFRIHDLKEATLCISELGTDIYHTEIVSRGLDIILEKGDKERELLNTLFGHLSKQKVLDSEHFEEGLGGLIEFVDDLIMDIPKILSHLATTMAPLMVQGVLSMAFLQSDATKPLLKSGKLREMSLMVFKLIEKASSMDNLIKLVSKSKLNLDKLSEKGNSKYLNNVQLDALRDEALLS